MPGNKNCGSLARSVTGKIYATSHPAFALALSLRGASRWVEILLGCPWGEGTDQSFNRSAGDPKDLADVRRLFPGSSPSGVRLNRLRNWPRVVVRVDDTVAAVATYTQTSFETQIPDFAIGIPSAVGSERSRLAERVLDALLDAIELASLAGECQRIVLIPSVASVDDMERRGYAVVEDGCAGSWMEKSLGRL